MSAIPGRVICPQCGANNFETQAACWKCHASLSASPSSPSATAAKSPAAPVAASGGTGAALYRPSAPVSSMDPSVAVWCGIVLAVLMPAIAVPVGLVFMMLDDRRRFEVGRLTLIAGILSTIVHLVLTMVLFQVTIGKFLPMAFQVIQTVQGRQQQPGLTDDVGDGGLRGIPGMPGLSGLGTPSGSAPTPPDQTYVPFPEPPRPR
ncbi:MAG: hypothetical protein OHK0029_06760 [Armatimonadaceae bacterium]